MPPTKSVEVDPQVTQARLNAQRRAASVVAAVRDEKKRQKERYGTLEQYAAKQHVDGSALPRLLPPSSPCGVFSNTIRAFQGFKRGRGVVPAGAVDLGYVSEVPAAVQGVDPIWLTSPSFMAPNTQRAIHALGLPHEAYTTKRMSQSFADVSKDFPPIVALFHSKMFPAVQTVNRDEVVALASALDGMFDSLPHARSLLRTSTPPQQPTSPQQQRPKHPIEGAQQSASSGDQLLAPIRERLQLTVDGSLPATGVLGSSSSGDGRALLDDEVVLRAQWEATHVLMLGWMEVIRQTYQQVAERGVLLERIRLCFVDVLLNAYDAAGHYRQLYEDVKAMNIHETIADLHSTLVDQESEITRLRKENGDLRDTLEAGRERDEEIAVLRAREDAIHTFVVNQMARNDAILKLQEESERRLQEERSRRVGSSVGGPRNFEEFTASSESNGASRRRGGAHRNQRGGQGLAGSGRRRSSVAVADNGVGEEDRGDLYQDGTYIPRGYRKAINITKAGVGLSDVHALDKSVSYAKEWLIRLRQRFRIRERRIRRQLKRNAANHTELDDADKEAIVKSIVRKTNGTAVDSDYNSSGDEEEDREIVGNYGVRKDHKKNSLDYGDDDPADDTNAAQGDGLNDSVASRDGSDCTVADIEDYDDRQFTFVRDAHVQVDAEFEEGKADSVYIALQGLIKQIDGTVVSSEGVVKKLYGTADVHDPSPLLQPALLKLDECKVALYDYYQRTLSHLDREAQREARQFMGGGDVADNDEAAANLGVTVLSRPNASPNAIPGYIRGAYVVPQAAHAQILLHLTETIEQLKKRFDTLAGNAQFQRALECRVPKHRTQPCDLCKRIEPDPELLKAHERFEDMKAQLQASEEQAANQRSELRKLERKLAAEQAATRVKNDELVAIQKQLQDLEDAANKAAETEDVPTSPRASLSPKGSQRSFSKKSFTAGSPTTNANKQANGTPTSPTGGKRRKSAIELVSEHIKSINDKMLNRREIDCQTDVTYGGTNQRHGAYHYHADQHSKARPSLIPLTTGLTSTPNRSMSLVSAPGGTPLLSGGGNRGSVTSATSSVISRPTSTSLNQLPSYGSTPKPPGATPGKSRPRATPPTLELNTDTNTPARQMKGRPKPLSLDATTLGQDGDDDTTAKVKEESQKLKNAAVGARRRLGMVSRGNESEQVRAPHGTIKMIAAIYKSKQHADTVAIAKYHQSVVKEYTNLWMQREQLEGGEFRTPPPYLLTPAQHTLAVLRLTAPCTEHVVEYTQTKLGAKSLVQKHTSALLTSIQDYSDMDHRIRLFGAFLTDEFNKPVYFWYLQLSKHLDAAGPKYDPKHLKSSGDDGKVPDVVPLDMALQCLAKMICGSESTGGELEVTETPFLTATPLNKDDIFEDEHASEYKKRLAIENVAKQDNAASVALATANWNNILELVQMVVAETRRSQRPNRRADTWNPQCMQMLVEEYNALLTRVHSLLVPTDPDVLSNLAKLRSTNLYEAIPTESPWELEIPRADFCQLVCAWMSKRYFATSAPVPDGDGSHAGSAPSVALFAENAVQATVGLPLTDLPVEVPPLPLTRTFSAAMPDVLSPSTRSMNSIIRTPSHRSDTMAHTPSTLEHSGVRQSTDTTQQRNPSSTSPPRDGGATPTTRPLTRDGGRISPSRGNTSSISLSRIAEMLHNPLHRHHPKADPRVSPLQPFMPTGYRDHRRPMTQEHRVGGRVSPPKQQEPVTARQPQPQGRNQANQTGATQLQFGAAFWKAFHPQSK